MKKDSQLIREILDTFTDEYILSLNIEQAKITAPHNTFDNVSNNEEWKYIDYLDIEKDRYKISSWGRIYDTILNEFKTTHLDGKGYVSVGLTTSSDRNSCTIRIHRLVAHAFMEKIQDKPHVNHIDLCKTNNLLDNLEWCDDMDNARHAIENGAWENKTTHNYFKPEDIMSIITDHKNSHSIVYLAKKYNRTESAMSAIVNRKSYNKTFWINMNYDINDIPDILH